MNTSNKIALGLIGLGAGILIVVPLVHAVRAWLSAGGTLNIYTLAVVLLVLGFLVAFVSLIHERIKDKKYEDTTHDN